MPILIILVAAFLIRLVAVNQSLWLDEAIGAIVAKTFSFGDILLKFPLTDNHPPLYYLILRVWSLLFGYSEVSLRFPSILFGIATIFLVYRIAKDFTKVNPLIPALLLATSPLSIYYSQEARMYSLAAFLATGAIYFFLRTVQDPDHTKSWIYLSVFYTLLAFSDYVPFFLYPVFLIYPLIKRMGWKWWERFIVLNIPLLVLGVAWLPTFIVQSEKGKWLLNILPAWRDIAGGATFKQLGVFWSKFVLGRISFYNKFLYYSLILLASIPVVVLLLKSLGKWKDGEMFWLWFLTPVVFGFFASLIFPAFIYFRFIFVLPAFYLLISLGRNRRLVTLVIIFNLVGWGIYVLDRSQWREDWRGAVWYVEANAGHAEVAVFENPEPFAPYRWYWDGRVESDGATDSISANAAPTFQVVRNITQGKDGIYYFEYLKDLQDPNGYVISDLAKLGFVEVGRVSFNDVGFIIHYQKKGNYAYRY